MAALLDAWGPLGTSAAYLLNEADLADATPLRFAPWSRQEQKSLSLPRVGGSLSRAPLGRSSSGEQLGEARLKSREIKCFNWSNW